MGVPFRIGLKYKMRNGEIVTLEKATSTVGFVKRNKPPAKLYRDCDRTADGALSPHCDKDNKPCQITELDLVGLESDHEDADS